MTQLLFIQQPRCAMLKAILGNFQKLAEKSLFPSSLKFC